VACIPICAVHGDNVARRSVRMSWYHGPALLELLETLPVEEHRLQREPFRFAVQLVNRPDATFRGFCGTIAAGVVRPGDAVRVAPSGRESRVARIVTADGDLDCAVAHQSVTLTSTASATRRSGRGC
jgi:bifunctional enzyme CysN/CysC